MIHPICFFSIEKEEYLFHMGLKTKWTEFECFTWNVFLWHYINEFIQIINWNDLNETFQAYRNFFSIVTRGVQNSRVTKLSCKTELCKITSHFELLTQRLSLYCFTFELLTPVHVSLCIVRMIPGMSIIFRKKLKEERSLPRSNKHAEYFSLELLHRLPAWGFLSIK